MPSRRPAGPAATCQEGCGAGARVNMAQDSAGWRWRPRCSASWPCRRRRESEPPPPPPPAHNLPRPPRPRDRSHPLQGRPGSIRPPHTGSRGPASGPLPGHLHRCTLPRCACARLLQAPPAASPRRPLPRGPHQPKTPCRTSHRPPRGVWCSLVRSLDTELRVCSGSLRAHGLRFPDPLWPQFPHPWASLKYHPRIADKGERLPGPLFLTYPGGFGV